MTSPYFQNQPSFEEKYKIYYYLILKGIWLIDLGK